MICIYCHYESETEVHEYTEFGEKIPSCDNVVDCVKREAEKLKKEVIKENRKDGN